MSDAENVAKWEDAIAHLLAENPEWTEADANVNFLNLLINTNLDVDQWTGVIGCLVSNLGWTEPEANTNLINLLVSVNAPK